MSSGADRGKREKGKNKSNVDDLRKALQHQDGTKSRLELLEDDDDDAVYDLVDEEEYAKIVESRRQNDFVVDDEGMGYYDDGEEHLGVNDDEYDHKKRLKEISEDADSKLAKKARRLAEAVGSQKNSILSFVRPGTSTIQHVEKSKAMSNEHMLDIDTLLKEVKTSRPSAAPMSRSRQGGPSYNRAAPAATRRPIMARPIAATTTAHASSYSGGDDYTYGDDDYGAGGNDDGMTAVDAGADDTTSNADNKTNKRVTFNTSTSHHTPTEKWSQGSSQSTIVTPGDQMHSEEVNDEPIVQKLNLSKTTKKLNFVEPMKKASDGIFKPALGDNTASLGLSDIMGSTLTVIDNASAAKAGTIDPQFWLQRTTVAATTTTATATTAETDAADTATTATTAPAKVEEFVNFYWLDACESNGVIYLFGKIPINEPGKDVYYVSSCVAVHGAERNLYALPRATKGFKPDGSLVRAGMAEVYQELNALLVPSIIPRSQGQSFRCKAVRRKYAFEHGDIPREETDYMKIVYSAKHPAPSAHQCEGGKHVERIFGASCSALELFLLKRELMGPCWITIRNPRTITDSISWCKVEIGIENPKFVSKMSKTDSLPTPPLVSMCVSMKTVLNPATHLHEIVALSGLIHTKVNCDKDTEIEPQTMKRFTYIRPLGLTCGNSYPANFPHDLQSEIKRVGGTGVLQNLPNERALLSIFFARVQQEDPDIFASHNLFGFEFDVLLSRAVANKVNDWSRLGRLRRSKIPKSIMDKDITCGRILCDTYKNAKEFLRETSYSLTSLSQSQLHIDRAEVDPVDVPKYFFNSIDILKMANHTACDALLVQKLVLKLQIIPLTKQLTNLSGNLWSRTVRGARAERIEYLLLHEFHALKYVLPEKKAFGGHDDNENTGAVGNSKGKKGVKKAHNPDGGDDDDGDNKVGGMSRNKAKAAYAGGLVLEPKKGLYDTYILLLDFNSLYPSIIQEYNLCFTTIQWTKFMPDEKPTSIAVVAKKSGNSNRTSAGDDDEEAVEEDIDDGDDIIAAKSLPPLPDTDSTPGVLPRVIRTLVERRREVKNLLKKERDPANRQSLDIRQKALKLTANSMYGCLGFAFSRFYARPIAALVTSMGREALQRTVDQATNQFGLDVIYGDTDSVMINTNSRDLAHVKELGNLVKREVNKLYKSLELDLDGIFKSMLLLKKKKYAAVVIKEVDGKIEYEKELKGLDLVRRDWCPLSKDTGKYVVDQILSGNPRDEIVLAIHDYLTEISRKVRQGELELGQFVVTKGLNKNPKDYPDTKGQPHLQVALAMLKANKPVNIGDHIPYVICTQGNETMEATMRAHHPDEVIRSPETLSLDYEWYLSNQILPPITRLCEPIEGTSAAQLSQCLGLDISKYARTVVRSDDMNDDDWGYTPQSKMDDVDRFQDCAKLQYKCTSCNQESEFKGAIEKNGLNCSLCGAMFLGRRHAVDCYSYLSNRVTLLMRECMKKYYDCWFVCDDPTCHRRTMQQPAAGMACVGDCHGRLTQEYTEAQLHTQMKYLESLFDLDRALKTKNLDPNGGVDRLIRVEDLKSGMARDQVEVFRLLNIHLTNEVEGSAYNWVRPSLWTAVFGRLVTAKTN